MNWPWIAFSMPDETTVTMGHVSTKTHTTTLAAGESLLDQELAGLAVIAFEKSLAPTAARLAA
jgi:hypothetical protein